MRPEHSVDLGFASAFGVLEHCPDCGAVVIPGDTDEHADFRCTDCGARWHLELGRVGRVEQAQPTHAAAGDGARNGRPTGLPRGA